MSATTPIFEALQHAWQHSIAEHIGWIGVPLILTGIAIGIVALLRLAYLDPRAPSDAMLKTLLAHNASLHPEEHFHHPSSRQSKPPLIEYLRQALHLVDVHAPATQRLQALQHQTTNKLDRHAQMLRALVATAPLLGLLGTVSGMIQTFAALHTAQSTGGLAQGAAAEGIGAALWSTQVGLIFAVWGLLAERLLQRRQIRMQDSLNTMTTALIQAGKARSQGTPSC